MDREIDDIVPDIVPDVLSDVLPDESLAIPPDPIGLNLLETDYRTDELERQRTEEFESKQSSSLIDNNPNDDETTTLDNYDGPLDTPVEDQSGADCFGEVPKPVCGPDHKTK